MPKQQINLLLIVAVISSFLLICCQGNTVKTDNDTLAVTINERYAANEQDSIEHKIIENGDTSAYLDLRIEYLDLPPRAILPYSKVMADKYHYPLACFDVYLSIAMHYNAIDKKLTREIVSEKDYDDAMKYLLMGRDLKDPQCIKTIEEFYLNELGK